MNHAINNKKIKPLFCILLSLNLLEGLITIISIISIPTDPKNAFFWGFSLSRLLILGISCLVLGIQIILFVNIKKVLKTLDHLFASARLIQWIKWVGAVAAICLWLTIWFPANRLETLAASFVRIKPLLLWLELIIFQVYVFSKLVLNAEIQEGNNLTTKNRTKIFRIILITVIIGVSLFVLLRILTPGTAGTQLIFPPGAPLSSLQLFLAWLLFIGIYLLERKNSNGFSTKLGWILATFLLLWVSTFIIWNSVPFTCTDDRPGPYSPNYQCYPTINDAVYTIGSHYVALGQGIYNHWLTDKPLYLVFLAIGQWVAGPRIDQYLIFQVAVLALIPPLLFLLGRWFVGYAGGTFLAVLAMMVGANEIHLYQLVGGVNAKLENPELLTALLLILLCFSIFKWFTQKDKTIWAAISGGVLGLSSLVRLNPIFIAPVLLLVIFVTGIKRKKSPLVEISVFIVAFALVFTPMISSLRDAQGNIYYLAKIQNVILFRYSNPASTNTPAPSQTTQTMPTSTEQATASQTGSQNELTYPPKEIPQNNGAGILVHFLNNEYSSLAILPVNLSFIGIEDQVKQSIWNFNPSDLIWERDLSFENILVLVLNFSIIILGICLSIKKFGLAGLSALIIQIGYHLGNAAAKTSGGRYLQPVTWVTLLYFLIGVFAITSFVFKILQPEKEKLSPLRSEKTIEAKELGDLQPKKIYTRLAGLMGLFLIVGLSIPGIDHLPSLLPEETSSKTTQQAETIINNSGSISAEQWKNFLNDPNHLVVRGKAYDAQYYRSNFYRSGDPSFEIMLLGKNHVFVNYLLQIQPDKPFADGSDAILVGCKIGQDNLWSANRIIMRSFAVIQLDHEKSIYVDPGSNWNCTK